MEETMSRNQMQREILKTIREFSTQQVNLQSAAAQDLLASRIAKTLNGKFYCLPFATRSSQP